MSELIIRCIQDVRVGNTYHHPALHRTGDISLPVSGVWERHLRLTASRRLHMVPLLRQRRVCPPESLDQHLKYTRHLVMRYIEIYVLLCMHTYLPEWTSTILNIRLAHDHTQMYTDKRFTGVFKHVRTRARACVRMCVCVCVSECECMFVSACVCLSVHVSVLKLGHQVSYHRAM